MLVIKTHYCLSFHKAVIVCLIALTIGINLFVGSVSFQNSFAQEFNDTNGDGVVNELNTAPTEPSASDAIDANGDGKTYSSSKTTSISYDLNLLTLCIGKDGTVGSKGPKMIELQSDLTQLKGGNLLGPPDIDGKFGPYTEGAVKQFQIDNGLKGKNGIAGRETWAASNL